VLCSDAARCCARPEGPEGLEGPEGRWWRAMEMLTAARKRGVEMNLGGFDDFSRVLVHFNGSVD